MLFERELLGRRRKESKIYRDSNLSVFSNLHTLQKRTERNSSQMSRFPTLVEKQGGMGVFVPKWNWSKAGKREPEPNSRAASEMETAETPMDALAAPEAVARRTWNRPPARSAVTARPES